VKKLHRTKTRKTSKTTEKQAENQVGTLIAYTKVSKKVFFIPSFSVISKVPGILSHSAGHRFYVIMPLYGN